jgi:hypothetical protein
VVDDLAVALGRHLGLAILEQLDIMVEDNLHGPIDTARTVRQGLLRPLRDLLHRLTPRCTRCVFGMAEFEVSLS